MGRRSDGVFALIGAIWGFAEATLFFVVPDVCVTAAGLRSRRAMVMAAWMAACGAVAGGVLMYSLGARDYTGAQRVLDRVPAVSPEMIERAGERLREHGLGELFIASVSGRPYKLYAVHAGGRGVSFEWFVLASLAARFARFLAAGMVVRLILSLLPERWRGRRAAVLLALFWVMLYAVYWGATGF